MARVNIQMESEIETVYMIFECVNYVSNTVLSLSCPSLCIRIWPNWRTCFKYAISLQNLWLRIVPLYECIEFVLNVEQCQMEVPTSSKEKEETKHSELSFYYQNSYCFQRFDMKNTCSSWCVLNGVHGFFIIDILRVEPTRNRSHIDLIGPFVLHSNSVR